MAVAALTHYLQSITTDVQTWKVAASVIRRSGSAASTHAANLPSQEALEAAIANECLPSTSGSLKASVSSVSFAVFSIANRIEKLVTEPLSNVAKSIFDRVKGFVSYVLSAGKTIADHPQLMVWVGGITVVAIAGAVAYTFWYSPHHKSIAAVRGAPEQALLLDEQEPVPSQNIINPAAAAAGAVVDDQVNVREALGDLPTCLVCYESFPRYACTQCGNLVLCQSHLGAYTSSHGHKCPICQGPTPFLLIRAP